MGMSKYYVAVKKKANSVIIRKSTEDKNTRYITFIQI